MEVWYRKKVFVIVAMVVLSSLALQTARTQDTEDKKPRLSIPLDNRNHISSISLSPNGKTLSIGLCLKYAPCEEAVIANWDISEGRYLGSVPYSKKVFISLEYGKRIGRLFTLGCDTGYSQSQKDKCYIQISDGPGSEPTRIIETHANTEIMAVSPDEKTVATAYLSDFYIYDVETGTLFQHSDLPFIISAIAYGPDSRTFAVSGWYPTRDKTFPPAPVYLYDLEKQKPPRPLEGKCNAHQIVFSQDGKYLATGDPVGIYDVESGKLLYGPYKNLSVRFDHENKLWLTALGPETHLFDVANNTVIATYDGVFLGSQTISHPNGNLLISESGYALMLWSIKNNKLEELVTIGHFSEKEWIVYDSNGNFDGSPGWENYASWKRGIKKLKPAEVEELNKPGLLSSVLQSLK